MFQFEYLNKQKMPGGFPHFEEKAGTFVESLPAGFDYAICRNPNYLNQSYFYFLESVGVAARNDKRLDPL